MNPIDLHGKTALVTGGSRGIGRATALLLARAGADIGIGYQSREEDAIAVVRLIQAEGKKTWAHAADLGNESGVLGLFERVDREFPRGLDIFIANAGIWP